MIPTFNYNLQLSFRQSTHRPSHLITRHSATRAQTSTITHQLFSVHPTTYDYHHCSFVLVTRQSITSTDSTLPLGHSFPPPWPVHSHPRPSSLKRHPFFTDQPHRASSFNHIIYPATPSTWRHKIHISMTRKRLGMRSSPNQRAAQRAPGAHAQPSSSRLPGDFCVANTSQSSLHRRI